MGYVPQDMGTVSVDKLLPCIFAYIYSNLTIPLKRNTRTFIPPSDQLYFIIFIPVAKPLFGFV